MIKKGILKLAFTAIFCFAVSMSASAQRYLEDQVGRLVPPKQYVDVQGSAFLSEEWLPGAVKLSNGKKYDDMQLKYDQVEDEVLFSDEKNQTMRFAMPVLEFTIDGRLFRQGYTSIDGAPATAFYEVLAQGQTQLLKRTSKKIFEQVPYASATKVKKIRTNEAYYLARPDGTLIKIRKDKKSLMEVLADKRLELEDYAKEKQLDLKQDADMAKLVTYYNVL